jgi:hypothetical protein
MAVPGFVAESTLDVSTDRTYRTQSRPRASRYATVVPQQGSGRAGTVCAGHVLHTLYYDDIPGGGVVFTVGEAIGSC